MNKSIYRILIVDDEEMMRGILVTRLSKEPMFQVFNASNGQEGLYSTFANNPDLILLDVQMPVMDGITMMKELRKDPRGKDIPIIFLTNYDTDENVLVKLSEGRPAFYLIKSNINLDEIVAKIKESLKIH